MLGKSKNKCLSPYLSQMKSKIKTVLPRDKQESTLPYHFHFIINLIGEYLQSDLKNNSAILKEILIAPYSLINFIEINMIDLQFLVDYMSSHVDKLEEILDVCGPLFIRCSLKELNTQPYVQVTSLINSCPFIDDYSAIKIALKIKSLVYSIVFPSLASSRHRPIREIVAYLPQILDLLTDLTDVAFTWASLLSNEIAFVCYKALFWLREEDSASYRLHGIHHISRAFLILSVYHPYSLVLIPSWMKVAGFLKDGSTPFPETLPTQEYLLHSSEPGMTSAIGYAVQTNMEVFTFFSCIHDPSLAPFYCLHNIAKRSQEGAEALASVILFMKRSPYFQPQFSIFSDLLKAGSPVVVATYLDIFSYNFSSSVVDFANECHFDIPTSELFERELLEVKLITNPTIEGINDFSLPLLARIYEGLNNLDEIKLYKFFQSAGSFIHDTLHYIRSMLDIKAPFHDKLLTQPFLHVATLLITLVRKVLNSSPIIPFDIDFLLQIYNCFTLGFSPLTNKLTAISARMRRDRKRLATSLAPLAPTLVPLAIHHVSSKDPSLLLPGLLFCSDLLDDYGDKIEFISSQMKFLNNTFLSVFSISSSETVFEVSLHAFKTFILHSKNAKDYFSAIYLKYNQRNDPIVSFRIAKMFATLTTYPQIKQMFLNYFRASLMVSHVKAQLDSPAIQQAMISIRILFNLCIPSISVSPLIKPEIRELIDTITYKQRIEIVDSVSDMVKEANCSIRVMIQLVHFLSHACSSSFVLAHLIEKKKTFPIEKIIAKYSEWNVKDKNDLFNKFAILLETVADKNPKAAESMFELTESSEIWDFRQYSVSKQLLERKNVVWVEPDKHAFQNLQSYIFHNREKFSDVLNKLYKIDSTFPPLNSIDTLFDTIPDLSFDQGLLPP